MTTDDREGGQPVEEGEHRPLSFDFPRRPREPYSDRTEDYNPSEDEYPPRDEFWPEQCENTERFETDDQTDWTQYVQYFCRHCAEDCINRLDEERTRTKQCWSCFIDPSITPETTLTRHLPEEARAGDGDEPEFVDGRRPPEAEPRSTDD